ncbi:T9SS sorting signal type C domain-containing protein [Flavobacterium ardleyense]|uniref:T9SS sorting signal type C domain-containing protein n=1 Tax=Flavobacterium ardleyense TaxID=2038737 RepID=A0ABW5ZAY1_9FLAO
MKRKILYLITFVSLANIASAQMYVSPTSYVFVNDQYVYVQQDLNIQANANFYLRNNSQLLQGGTTGSANKGAGDLSVFQEGTVNNFQYNYWCSPVGAAEVGPGNNQFGISRLFRPTTLTTSAAAIVNGGHDGAADPLMISPRWIHKFVASSAYSQWVFVGNTTTIGPGEGFSMKGTSGTDLTIVQAAENVQNNPGNKQRYDFRGKPNDGDISVAVLKDNFTLVGNPYPSAIDLHDYILANSAFIDGTLYFWEQSTINSHILNEYQGGYGTFTIAGGYVKANILRYNGDGSINSDTGNFGSLYKRRFAPVGQGFMVVGLANGVATMKNSFRLFRKEGLDPADSEFARIAAGAGERNSNLENEFYPEIPNVAGKDYTTIRTGYAPQLRINALVNDAAIIHTALGFGDQYTDGVDYSADAAGTSEDSPYSFYYVLNDSPNEFSMSITSFNNDKRLPVGLRNNLQATFKIKINELLYGFDPSQEVFIFDKQTGIYHDIKNSTFEITLPAGDNRTRFEITFKNETLSSEDIAAVNDAFSVNQNNEQGMLTLFNKTNKDIASVVLYDIAGKQVLRKTNLGTDASYQFSTSGLSDGIYIVKATTKDNIAVSKKVSIYKK